jgi:aminobenzoyl-glutamate utilization protein B
MLKSATRALLATCAVHVALSHFAFAQNKVSAEKEASIKADLAGQVDAMKKQAQVMVDSVFSFGELGMQEFETSKYLSGILEKEGFRVTRGVAGIPTAFVAEWGSGKPVISLGSDIDDIPQASQKPGVGYHDPLVEGAPGHGEGHNSGVPLNIVAALAVKKIMEREHLQGTIRLWPGVAEEEVATKAYYVKAGMFKDVDVCLFTHVGANLGVGYGGSLNQNGLVSVEYLFKGESAHAAGAPWRGKSALDAVELMDVGWNFRREHLRLATRLHYVITNGGDQPNVVPPTASVWYYYREADYDHIMNLWRIGDNMAQAATLMTDTTWSSRVLGSAWPGHFNVPIAEDMYRNITKVGLPTWSDDDQKLAKALQKELGVPQRGLAMTIPELRRPRAAAATSDEGEGGVGPTGGGSDDIGDVSWAVPTVTLNYPSNIPGGPGHNWANGISMATPIAHKGVVAGAKVQAMTMLDIILHPELVKSAWDYYNNVQTKDVKYKSLLRPQDTPAIWLNDKTMEKYRPEMKKYYYDPSKYDNYLDQLGIKYPTVR